MVVLHDALVRDRCRREVATTRLVGGARTAPVVGADPDTAIPWLATQYVPGPSLHEAVAQAGPFFPTDVAHHGLDCPRDVRRRG